MHSSTGDKIANEIKELRKVLENILDLLRPDVCSQQVESTGTIPEIVIRTSVFDSEYLLRGEKPE